MPADPSYTDPSYIANDVREIYPLLPGGQVLKDTAGTIVTNAVITVLQFTDCDMTPIVYDSTILQINAMGFGAYCVEYLVQRFGEAHLIVLPVLAGHTFDPIQVLLKRGLSNNELKNIAQSCVDALTSANPVLTAVGTIQSTTDKLQSMIEQAGAGYRFNQGSVSLVLSAIPTPASIQSADSASLAASGLSAGSVAMLVSKLSQIDDAEWGSITKNPDGSYSVAEIGVSAVRGVVAQTYDSAGKLLTKTVTGLV